jgi:hypothetical protein
MKTTGRIRHITKILCNKQQPTTIGMMTETAVGLLRRKQLLPRLFQVLKSEGEALNRLRAFLVS